MVGQLGLGEVGLGQEPWGVVVDHVVGPVGVDLGPGVEAPLLEPWGPPWGPAYCAGPAEVDLGVLELGELVEPSW